MTKDQWKAAVTLAITIRNTWRRYDDNGYDLCRHCLQRVTPHSGIQHKPDCPVLLTDLLLGEHTHNYRNTNVRPVPRYDYCRTWDCARRRPK